MTSTEVAHTVETAIASFIDRDQRPQVPHPYVYASAWRVCPRRMTLEMTVPDRQPPFSTDLRARFRRGADRERDLLADLSRAGRDADPPFQVVGQQQRFELKDRQGRVIIVGKVDGRIQIGPLSAPLEVKAWSPMLTDRIERFDDLFDNPWTKSGAHQLLAYMYGAGEPAGFLLLDRSGLPRLIPVDLESHLDRMEDFLFRAERACDHAAAGTLPEYLVGDAVECRRCPFYGSVCNPPLAHPGVTVLTDPDLEALLEARETVREEGQEYDRLDKAVKARLRGIESGVIGHFNITGTWGKTSRVELPADVRKRYTTTDPQGRFTIEITREGS